MATISSWDEQVKNRQPDWSGRLKKRFRWSKLRFEYGWYFYIVYPVEGPSDVVWWEWETK